MSQESYIGISKCKYVNEMTSLNVSLKSILHLRHD